MLDAGSDASYYATVRVDSFEKQLTLADRVNSAAADSAATDSTVTESADKVATNTGATDDVPSDNVAADNVTAAADSNTMDNATVENDRLDDVAADNITTGNVTADAAPSSPRAYDTADDDTTEDDVMADSSTADVITDNNAKTDSSTADVMADSVMTDNVADDVIMTDNVVADAADVITADNAMPDSAALSMYAEGETLLDQFHIQLDAKDLADDGAQLLLRNDVGADWLSGGSAAGGPLAADTDNAASRLENSGCVDYSEGDVHNVCEDIGLLSGKEVEREGESYGATEYMGCDEGGRARDRCGAVVTQTTGHELDDTAETNDSECESGTEKMVSNSDGNVEGESVEGDE